jgi:phosphatidylinositol kinase/protein kinase (PI-3  family)
LVKRGWGLQTVIAKSNDDLRQEVFVMQLISFYDEVFKKEKLDLWVKPYSILSTGKSTGLIQVLENSISLAGLKKKPDYPGSLALHFERLYGRPGSESLEAARRRFAQSLAGYSIVAYLLALKDRHNGNIMITSEGRVVHIDYGFAFGQAPGNAFSFERAEFKLTKEYGDTLGGVGSPAWKYYVKMVEDGLVAAREYAQPAITMIEIMSFQSEFPCFKGQGSRPLESFKRRLLRDLSPEAVRAKAQSFVSHSYDHAGTNLYDKFQLLTNDIPP